MRRIHRPILALLALVLLVGISTLEAQRPQTRQGFWGHLGIGWASLSCEDCDNSETGGAGALTLGGTLNQKWQLGGGGHVWTKSEDGVTLTVGLVSGLAKFYPSATGGFYLTLGLGMASIDVEVSGAGSGRETGSGALIGAGYDFRVGRNVSITPFWNSVGSRYDGGTYLSFSQLGVGVTLH